VLTNAIISRGSPRLSGLGTYHRTRSEDLLEVLNKEVDRLDRFEAHDDLWLRDGVLDNVDAAISWHLTSAIEAVEPMNVGVKYSQNRPFVCGATHVHRFHGRLLFQASAA
jgi:hypothetical protein